MGKKSVVFTKELLSQTLASEPFQGKHLLEPLKSFAAASGWSFNILEDKDITNEVERHMHESDLWFCLEGEIEFIYGGEMVNPWIKKNPDGSEDTREIKAKEIKNGTKVILHPGEWIAIAPGDPHQHNKLDGHARLVIIKIPEVR